MYVECSSLTQRNLKDVFDSAIVAGITSRNNRAKKKKALNTTAVVSLKGSYTIWLSRYNKIWSDNWQLAERPC